MSKTTSPIRSLILFGSPTKLTNAHKLVTGGPKPPHGAKAQPPYFVRASVFNGDFEEALSAAGKRILKGETILNTVPVEES